MSDSQKHETIADIIAKKRARADRIERNVAENLARGKMTSGWFVRDLIASIREDADRLEAAWKREKAEIEADALNVGAVVATTEKSSAVGDAAAMREALVEVRDKLPHFLQYMRLRRTDDDGGYYDRLLATINAALSAPRRGRRVLADDRLGTAKPYRLQASHRPAQDRDHSASRKQSGEGRDK